MFCYFVVVYKVNKKSLIKSVLEIALISESRALIAGSHELYMKEESEVALHCRIEDSPGPPTFIYWYKVILGKGTFCSTIKSNTFYVIYLYVLILFRMLQL